MYDSTLGSRVIKKKKKNAEAWHGRPSSTSLGLTDYSQVDKLGQRYRSVNFGEERARAHQIGEPK